MIVKVLVRSSQRAVAMRGAPLLGIAPKSRGLQSKCVTSWSPLRQINNFSCKLCLSFLFLLLLEECSAVPSAAVVGKLAFVLSQHGCVAQLWVFASAYSPSFCLFCEWNSNSHD